MEATFNKLNLSPEFLSACKRYAVKETEKQITVKVPLTPVQEAMLQSGQLTKKSIKNNIEQFIF